MNVFGRHGLRQVINGCGKMTLLGATAVIPPIAEAVHEALGDYVVIEELIDYTGTVIAEKTGAESGCPTCGAASATAISVAAVIAGEDLYKIEQLPDSTGLRNQIIIQRGHIIDFGGSIEQMIRLGGGKVVEVGSANRVQRDHIVGAITGQTAALFYVQSHHAVQKGMQSLETMLEIGKKYGIPLIVDAAAEEDLRKYISLGADLVFYSGGKALGGPTVGFICGAEKYIRACKKQYKGIGRGMKVSKEAMMGLVAALELYGSIDDSLLHMEKVKWVCDELNEVEGLSCSIQQDESGREIYRACIEVDAAHASLSATELSDRLKNDNPAIFLRDYDSAVGKLFVDPRPLLEGQERILVEQIKKYVKEAAR